MTNLLSIISKHTKNYIVNEEYRYIDFVLKGNSKLESKLKENGIETVRYNSYFKGSTLKLVRIRF